MKGKRLALSLIIVFAAAYAGFGAWIAHDTKRILVKAMSGDPDYTDYMSEAVYHDIHPVERDMTKTGYAYDPAVHDIGFVFPLHFFGISLAYVTQQYSSEHFGFREPVRLTLQLKSGKWYAAGASIQP
ncbi:hypothetical protein FHS19_004746 [Paenibacillus rhizosphaerae]|uniref:Uncharacterized protein n=1 Tax=Paenibacillus rhizosphaerae TaxID=297318 RepID=A0A839TU20_9BACL|nr:hypothetical protein [Paenibacillus rhizosphaerae]MBB3130041.1 hypothetical protein [Paenibacillus rhizosphaerae]